MNFPTHHFSRNRGRSAIQVALFAVIIFCGNGAAPLWAAPVSQVPAQELRTFFEEHCFACHDSQSAEAGLDLETLAAPNSPELIRTWINVHDRLATGEMPPPEEPRPRKEIQAQALAGMAGTIAAAEQELRSVQGRTAWRRLNRQEFQNTVRDLLHVDLEVREMLTSAGSDGGFASVDQSLDISAVLIEKYLAAADALLDAAIVHGERPKTETKRLVYKEDKGALGESIGEQVLGLEDAVVFTNELYPPKIHKDDRARVPGRYRYRLSAYAYNTEGATTPILIYAGSQNPQHGKTELTQLFDAPAGEPQVFEWVEQMLPGDRIRVVTHGPNKPWQVKAPEYQGTGLAAQWLEVEGPLIEQWPPRSHSELLGEFDLKTGTAAEARAVLRRFVPRAFRRPIVEEEIDPFVRLFESAVEEGQNPEAALRVALKGVLVAPEFLFLTADPGKLTEYQLASRLSYSLWSSMPDAELLACAARGELARPEVLRAQVERLLGDRRAAGFVENFTGQWLGLRELKATSPDSELYPEFDALLERSMLLETTGFFREILENDLSVLNFIESDFAMLNSRLAEHYGIPGVEGLAIRRVPLQPGWNRGGVMTQAAILKVTANGTNTSPVSRGAWVLDHLLGESAPPPPQNVPAIEPDIRGAVTIREQLAAHRDVATCARCHVKIDPPGNALECFDVIGGFRELYRKKAPEWKDRKDNPAGGRFPYGEAARVETGDVLSDGRAFSNLQEYKALLLADREARARAIAGKLFVYATGHELEFQDRKAIAEITASTKNTEYGLRSLIHAIVASPAFQSK